MWAAEGKGFFLCCSSSGCMQGMLGRREEGQNSCFSRKTAHSDSANSILFLSRCRWRRGQVSLLSPSLSSINLQLFLVTGQGWDPKLLPHLYKTWCNINHTWMATEQRLNSAYNYLPWGCIVGGAVFLLELKHLSKTFLLEKFTHFRLFVFLWMTSVYSNRAEACTYFITPVVSLSG